MAVLPVAVPRTKFVGERPTSSKTRCGRAAVAEREPSPFNEIIFDSREHYERSKLIFNREILHERVINFENQGLDFMHERIEKLGWSFMYNDLVDINLTIVREFYSNFSHADQNTEEDAYEQNLTEKRAGRLYMDVVLGTIAAPGMRWDTYNPKSDTVDNGILTTNARRWLKMIICNLQQLRHETTISMDTHCSSTR
ncbi:hypothetical protein PIB30_072334 [Stylosanthes scabra]|uniref:Uncharacterized protein n=1 Tax=Stylosanthes scabra TaxID=79078 RepID=A0ABU6WNM8_9FABA|nr:hypothetical protein [Stylosanthes scabra]